MNPLTSRLARLIRWSALLILFSCFAAKNATLTGDGWEYVLTAKAWLNHGSPDIRSEDLSGFDVRPWSQFGSGRPIAACLEWDGLGYVRTCNDAVYAIHFGLYSLVSAPLVAGMDALGIRLVVGFALLNALLMTIAVYVIWTYFDASVESRVALVLLFVTSGSTYYIWWTHPELMTSSLLIMALALPRKYFGFSALLTGIAATQNPPVAAITAAVSLVVAFDHFSARRAGIANPSTLQLVCAACGACCVLAPIVWSLLATGVPSLISATGQVDMELATPRRVLSLFLDPNMGVLAAAPAVIGLTAVSLAFSLQRFRRELSSLVQIAAAVLIVLLMAVVASATTNFNHGHTVFSRYAYWLAIPFMILSIRGLEAMRAPSRNLIYCSAILLQLAVLTYFDINGGSWRGAYLGLKPIATRLLSRAPGLYNPDPEVFFERVVNREVALDAESRTVWFPSQVEFSKILVRRSSADSLFSSLKRNCPQLTRVLVNDAWVYLNASPKCRSANE